MTDHRDQWTSGEVLAYTEREGPGRPPGGAPGWAMPTIAVVLGATLAGIVLSDTLCPEHRAWVQVLGGLALIGAATALVAIWRGWAGATTLTLLSSLAGVAIGVLDAAHSTSRGPIVALAFAFVGVVAAFVGWRTHRLARWDQSLVSADLPAEPAAPHTADQAPRVPTTA